MLAWLQNLNSARLHGVEFALCATEPKLGQQSGAETFQHDTEAILLRWDLHRAAAQHQVRLQTS